MNGFVDMYSYIEGHYEDSGLSLEELEQSIIKSEEENKKLKSWEEAVKKSIIPDFKLKKKMRKK